MKKLTFGIPLLVFLVTFAVYAASSVTDGSDTNWTLYVAESFVKTGDFDLNEYARFIHGDYRVEIIDRHRYSIYPLGTPLMAAPFVMVLDRLPVTGGLPLGEYLAQHRPDEIVLHIAKLIASFLVAVNCVVMYALARQHLDIAKSIFLTLIFAFATAAWSVASRGLWQHGPSMLCLSLTLYVLLAARRTPSLVPLASIPLAFSFVVRPTNVIPIVVLTTYVWFAHRRSWIWFVLCQAAILVPLFAHNYQIYSSFLPPYYSSNHRFTPYLAEALVGNLVSPSRGLLIFSPILVFSLAGFYRSLRQSPLRLDNLTYYVLAIVVLHWIMISSFWYWQAGWSIGPRYFVDVIPFLVYLMVPVLDRAILSRHHPLVKPQMEALVFTVLLVFSVFVQYRCSNDPGPWSWNGIPADISAKPERAWDWSDIQFLRGLCQDKEQPAPGCWFANADKAGSAGTAGDTSAGAEASRAQETSSIGPRPESRSVGWASPLWLEWRSVTVAV